jgi:hypothetical protein
MNRVRRYGASKEGGQRGNLPADISAVGTQGNGNKIASGSGDTSSPGAQASRLPDSAIAELE